MFSITKLLLSSSLVALSTMAQESYSLEQLLYKGLSQNPSLKEQKHYISASSYKSEIARALPDPQIQLSYYIDEVETRVGPQEGSVGISQQIPWLKKLDLKRRDRNSKT